MLVEFDFGSAVLQPTLSALEGVSVKLDHIVQTDEGRLRAAVWIRGDVDEATLADRLAADSTVGAFTHLATTDDWTLYRIVYAEGAPEEVTFSAAVDNDGATLRATTEGDGWHLQMRFPDRDSFCRFRDRCEDAGVSIAITALYDDRYEPPSPGTALSGPQRAALATAFDVGYFGVPRGGTLGEVADRLGVSSQAASERIRRGLATLVGDVVDGDGAAATERRDSSEA